VPDKKVVTEGELEKLSYVRCQTAAWFVWLVRTYFLDAEDTFLAYRFGGMWIASGRPTCSLWAVEYKGHLFKFAFHIGRISNQTSLDNRDRRAQRLRLELSAALPFLFETKIAVAADYAS